MKNLWFRGLAWTLGLLGGSAFGQFPTGQFPTNYNNFGPSSYPMPSQVALQNLPQVPATFAAPAPQNSQTFQPVGQYQLVGMQQSENGAVRHDQAPPAPAPAANTMPGLAPHIQQPVPPQTNATSDCQSCAPHATPGYQSAPALGYQAPPAAGYASAPPAAYSMAPNAAACGPAPITGAYMVGGQAAANRWQPSRPNLFSGMPSQSRNWFGSAGVLLINRVDDKIRPLSFEDASYAPDILTTRDARFGTAGGFEATLGRYFNCGRNAIQATYWGIFPDDELALRSRTTPGDYRSRIPFTYMLMPGTPAAPATPYGVYDWFENAYSHSLQRSAEYHNVEVNLLGFAMGGAARCFSLPANRSMFKRTGGAACGDGSSSCTSLGGCASSGSCGPCSSGKFGTGPCSLSAPTCGSRLNVTWLAGFRYFHFSDNLLYAASLDDSVINRSPDDLYYQVDTTNDLYGFQLGSRINYCLGQRINVFGSAKVGIYNNRSNLYTRIGTDFQTAYLNDTRTPVNPNNGANYQFDVNDNQVAFLSEMNTGMAFRVSNAWSATCGYRAVIASGVATATDNLQNSFANYTDVQRIDNYGLLILHGLNIGGVFNY